MSDLVHDIYLRMIEAEGEVTRLRAVLAETQRQAWIKACTCHAGGTTCAQIEQEYDALRVKLAEAQRVSADTLRQRDAALARLAAAERERDEAQRERDAADKALKGAVGVALKLRESESRLAAAVEVLNLIDGIGYDFGDKIESRIRDVLRSNQ